METVSYLYVKIVYNIVHDVFESPRSKGGGCGNRLKIGWGYGDRASLVKNSNDKRNEQIPNSLTFICVIRTSIITFCKNKRGSKIGSFDPKINIKGDMTKHFNFRCQSYFETVRS